jgi:hypothetical protein
MLIVQEMRSDRRCWKHNSASYLKEMVMYIVKKKIWGYVT